MCHKRDNFAQMERRSCKQRSRSPDNEVYSRMMGFFLSEQRVCIRSLQLLLPVVPVKLRVSVALHHFSVLWMSGRLKGWGDSTLPLAAIHKSPAQREQKKKKGRKRRKKKNTRATKTKGEDGIIMGDYSAPVRFYCCLIRTAKRFSAYLHNPWLIVAKSEVECGFESINTWLFFCKSLQLDVL